MSLALVFTGAGAAIAASTVRSGFEVSGVAAATQDNAVVITSTAWTNVQSVSVGAQTADFVVARFTAESLCSGPSGGWCSVRILVGGVEADPRSGTDFAFDSTDNGTAGNSWQSHSVERSAASGGGVISVTVQAALVNGATSFRLDDWTLTAMAVT